MGNNNQYNGKTLQEVIRKLLTFDQNACFESVRKQMMKEIRKDRNCNRVVSQEEYMSSAMFRTTLYFTNHHLPRLFYTEEFVQEKYPELVQRIRDMVQKEVERRKEGKS